MATQQIPLAAGEEAESRPTPSRAWRTFWQHPMAKAGVGGLVFIVLFTFVGPLLYPVSPYTVHIDALLHPPDAQFPLGTDELGRSTLARVMVGGQLSLLVGFAAALTAMLIGVVYGLISGLSRPSVDGVMMRAVDILLAVPPLFILLFLDAVFRPSAVLLVIILGVTSWFGVSRLVRSEVLSLRQREFVEAARAFGASPWHIMRRELFPNVIGTVMVAATFQVANAILVVAGLSFLGLGLPPPVPNWGGMLATSMDYLFDNTWWLTYPPGLAILITVMSVNFIQEALRAAFDARF